MKHRRRSKVQFPAIVLFFLGLQICAVAGDGALAAEAWVRTYNAGEMGADDRAFKVVVDGEGGVIVAGYTDDGRTGKDMLIVKYSGTGVPLWTNRYDGPGHSVDLANAVAVNRGGKVFVTGSSVGSNGFFGYATIAYSGAGEALWTNRFHALEIYNNEAYAVAVDEAGNAFVTGYSRSINFEDYLTIAYSGAGVALWTNRYEGPHADTANAVAVDNLGNVFVTGRSIGASSFWGCATLAYSRTGVPLWTNRYERLGSNSDEGIAVAADNLGRVFVAGYSTTFNGNNDYLILAYSVSGAVLWTNHYNGPGNGFDLAASMAVSSSGHVFVTGQSKGIVNDDYATVAYTGAGMPLWTNRYNGSANSNDLASSVAVDGSGNVFVTGYSTAQGNLRDYTTIAYTESGAPRWTNHFDGPGHDDDRAQAVAVDPNGEVLVAGYSVGGASGFDFTTLKLTGAGVALWTNRFNRPGYRNDRATAVVVGTNGMVFVTGYSLGGQGNYDYATLAYSREGVVLWTNRYNGPENGDDYAHALAVDNNGRVFVAGGSQGTNNLDYLTIAYAESGVALWTNRYNGPTNGADVASAMTVDGSGHLFVTGYSSGASGWADFLTIAYEGTSGLALWTNRYNGLGNYEDYAKDITTDPSGHVFVTGYASGVGTSRDYATIAYSNAGLPLWTNLYNGLGNGHDEPSAVAADTLGNVFVTGSSRGSGGNADSVTLAYSWLGAVLWTNHYAGPGNGDDQGNDVVVDPQGRVCVVGSSVGNGSSPDYMTLAYSGAGVALWTNLYNGPGNGYDVASAVVVDPHGNVFVTGYSAGSQADFDYATIAYSALGVALWTNRYDGTRHLDDWPFGTSCLALGPEGAVYVTGLTDAKNGADASYDYATVKYVGQVRLELQSLTAGASTVNLDLRGIPGASWSIEGAETLTGSWSRLGTVQLGPDGRGHFQDLDPPAPSAFYRAVQPDP